MALVLRVRSEHGRGRELNIRRNKFLIGRAEDCHLRPNNTDVSRHHCVVLTDPWGVTVRDLDTPNGTFVNGCRVTGPVELNSGDILKVGPLLFEVEIRTLVPQQVVAESNSAVGVHDSSIWADGELAPATRETVTLSGDTTTVTGDRTSTNLNLPPKGPAPAVEKQELPAAARAAAAVLNRVPKGEPEEDAPSFWQRLNPLNLLSRS